MGKAIYDNGLLLKDAGAVVADTAGTVGGQARFLDIGTGTVEGKLVSDCSAVDFASADETYRAVLQGSLTTNFAAPVELTSIDVKGVGRREQPFSNDIGGVRYRYVRLFNDTGGTTPSINNTAFITKR